MGNPRYLKIAKYNLEHACEYSCGNAYWDKNLGGYKCKNLEKDCPWRYHRVPTQDLTVSNSVFCVLEFEEEDKKQFIQEEVPRLIDIIQETLLESQPSHLKKTETGRQ